jgi:hypothetical protein
MRRREVGGARWRGEVAVGGWRGEAADTRSGGGYQPNPGPTDATNAPTHVAVTRSGGICLPNPAPTDAINAPPTWRLPDPEAITCRMWGLKRLLTTANSSPSGNRHPLRRAGDVGGPSHQATPPPPPPRSGSFVRFWAQKPHKTATSREWAAQNCHLARRARPRPPPSPSPTAPCMTSGQERGPVRNSIGETSIRKDNRS